MVPRSVVRRSPTLAGMAKHEIEVTVPAQRIFNADLTVIVRSDGSRLGELGISKGSLDWRPAKRQSAISMRWETFAALIEDWDARGRR